MKLVLHFERPKPGALVAHGTTIDLLEDNTLKPFIYYDTRPGAKAHHHRQKLGGWVRGSVVLQARRQHTWDEWLGVAYACWLDDTVRRSLYADVYPSSDWPDYVQACWEVDLVNADAIRTARASATNGHNHLRDAKGAIRVPPCGCACCFGGFCGGCGHAGCGGR